MKNQSGSPCEIRNKFREGVLKKANLEATPPVMEARRLPCDAKSTCRCLLSPSFWQASECIESDKSCRRLSYVITPPCHRFSSVDAKFEVINGFAFKTLFCDDILVESIPSGMRVMWRSAILLHLATALYAPTREPCPAGKFISKVADRWQSSNPVDKGCPGYVFERH